MNRVGKLARPHFRGFGLLEVLAWSVTLVCVGTLGLTAVRAHSSAGAAQAITPQKTFSVAVTAHAVDESVIGRLEIPKLGLTVPILRDYDPDSLKSGVGHIPGTASPGGLGNLGLAGHRDTFLRPLRNVKLGMQLEVITVEGRFLYQVDSTEIVLPEQVSVLDIHGRPELTLITCYPFDFVGAAPKRFIVHAHLLSL